MTKRDMGIAVVVGSQILGLLKTMPIEEQTKGAFINYSQFMRAKIWKVNSKDRKKWADVCYNSLTSLLGKGFDNSITMTTLVESLSFTFEKELKAFYGDDYFPRMMRFCDKHSYDYTSEFAKDSYIVADALADAVRKEFYEAFKGDKDERDSTRVKKVA